MCVLNGKGTLSAGLATIVLGTAVDMLLVGAFVGGLLLFVGVVGAPAVVFVVVLAGAELTLDARIFGV